MNHIWVFCDNSANESNKKVSWIILELSGSQWQMSCIYQPIITRWSGGHQNCHFVIQCAADRLSKYIFDNQWIWKSFLSCFWQISSNNLNSFLPKKKTNYSILCLIHKTFLKTDQCPEMSKRLRDSRNQLFRW